jgi:hypothetical protein
MPDNAVKIAAGNERSRAERVPCASQMAPYSLYSTLLLTRALWALIKTNILCRYGVSFGILTVFKSSALCREYGVTWDNTSVNLKAVQIYSKPVHSSRLQPGMEM